MMPATLAITGADPASPAVPACVSVSQPGMEDTVTNLEAEAICKSDERV